MSTIKTRSFARAMWNIVWALFARWTPDHSNLFNAWRAMLVRLFGAKIGAHCVIKSSCEIWQPWNLTLPTYYGLSTEEVKAIAENVMEMV